MERLLQAGIIEWQAYLQWHREHYTSSSEATEDEARTTEIRDVVQTYASSSDVGLPNDFTDAPVDVRDPVDPQDLVQLFEEETGTLEVGNDVLDAFGASGFATSSKVTLDMHPKSVDETKFMASRLANDMKTMTAMTGKKMYRLLRATLVPLFGKEAMKRWLRKVEDHKSTKENVREEMDRMDDRIKKYGKIYTSLGLPTPPVIR